ncbi:MAG: DUF3775 domain-containing protein [Gammaproteobacteria bacterium]|nr:DUF3775 domain-containing protein [Gammaproteobacteria bacterium]MDH3506022.1 DUF3775 domain-containing protein [Gammaproteobacteria bacterium]
MDLNPDTVRFIIDKAREFHVKEEVTIPEEPLSPSDDWARQILADHADDPSYQEVKATIDDLEPDQQVTLVALMWLGRGDYAADEWDNAVENAQDSWNERTAEYLLGTPLVADYLSEGLDELGYD